MKKIAFFVTTVFLLSSFLYYTPGARGEENGLAPDFQLSDTQGLNVSLSGYRGKKPALLLFWTTWCPYCRKALISLSKMNPQLEKDGLKVLAINIGEAGAKVDNFIATYGLVFKALLDKDSSVAKSYEVVGIPTYVLINKKGKIVFQGNSFPESEYKNLIK